MRDVEDFQSRGKPVGNLRSSQFGTSTSLAGPPRQVELGVRFDF